MRSIVVEAAALLAAMFLTGCGKSETGSTATIERDSAGIVIIENHGPYPEWRIAAGPELRIGTVEGDSAYQFHRIRFAARLSDGRVVVLDGGSTQVRWYGEDGSFRSHIGRKGGGPGEFSSFGTALLTADDTLIVYDPGNRRLSWMAPDESFARELPANAVPAGRVTILRTGDPADPALAVSVPTFEIRHPDFNYNHDTLTVIIPRPVGLDTIMRRPGTEGAVWARFSGGQPVAMQQMGIPFAHEVRAAGTGARLALIDGEAHQLEIRDWNGSLRALSRRADSPVVPISDDDREGYVDAMVQSAVERGSTELGAAERNARDVIATVPEGHTFPWLDDVLQETSGAIWIRDFVPTWLDPTDRTWTEYDPDGVVRRRVTLPAGLTVMHVASDRVTGVERDSLDVEYVVVYRIEAAPRD